MKHQRVKNNVTWLRAMLPRVKTVSVLFLTLSSTVALPVRFNTRKCLKFPRIQPISLGIVFHPTLLFCRDALFSALVIKTWSKDTRTRVSLNGFCKGISVLHGRRLFVQIDSFCKVTVVNKMELQVDLLISLIDDCIFGYRNSFWVIVA